MCAKSKRYIIFMSKYSIHTIDGILLIGHAGSQLSNIPSMVYSYKYWGFSLGQHRLLSLMNVLLGFRVCDSLSKSPPIYFEMADQFRPPYSYWQSKMWNGLAKKCTVRLAYAKEVMPFDENFERLAQEYSKRRDTEQAHTRLRSLWDV